MRQDSDAQMLSIMLVRKMSVGINRLCSQINDDDDDEVDSVLLSEAAC